MVTFFSPLKNTVIPRTCLLSPPAGRRTKIPRTREGKPCMSTTLPPLHAATWCSRRGYGSIGALGHSSALGPGPTQLGARDPGLPSIVRTTPPASCPKPDDALRVHSRLSHIRKTRLFNTPKVIDYTQLQRKANKVTAANAVFFPRQYPTLDLRQPTGIEGLRTPQIDSLT